MTPQETPVALKKKTTEGESQEHQMHTERQPAIPHEPKQSDHAKVSTAVNAAHAQVDSGTNVAGTIARALPGIKAAASSSQTTAAGKTETKPSTRPLPPPPAQTTAAGKTETKPSTRPLPPPPAQTTAAGKTETKPSTRPLPPPPAQTTAAGKTETKPLTQKPSAGASALQKDKGKVDIASQTKGPAASKRPLPATPAQKSPVKAPAMPSQASGSPTEAPVEVPPPPSGSTPPEPPPSASSGAAGSVGPATRAIILDADIRNRFFLLDAAYAMYESNPDRAVGMMKGLGFQPEDIAVIRQYSLRGGVPGDVIPGIEELAKGPGGRKPETMALESHRAEKLEEALAFIISGQPGVSAKLHEIFTSKFEGTDLFSDQEFFVKGVQGILTAFEVERKQAFHARATSWADEASVEKRVNQLNTAYFHYQNNPSEAELSRLIDTYRLSPAEVAVLKGCTGKLTTDSERKQRFEAVARQGTKANNIHNRVSLLQAVNALYQTNPAEAERRMKAYGLDAREAALCREAPTEISEETDRALMGEARASLALRDTFTLSPIKKLRSDPSAGEIQAKFESIRQAYQEFAATRSIIRLREHIKDAGSVAAIPKIFEASESSRMGKFETAALAWVRTRNHGPAAAAQETPLQVWQAKEGEEAPIYDEEAAAPSASQPNAGGWKKASPSTPTPNVHADASAQRKVPLQAWHAEQGEEAPIYDEEAAGTPPQQSTEAENGKPASFQEWHADKDEEAPLAPWQAEEDAEAAAPQQPQASEKGQMPPQAQSEAPHSSSAAAEARKAMLDAHLFPFDPAQSGSEVNAIAQDFAAGLHKIMLDNEAAFVPGPSLVINEHQSVAFGKPMLVGDGVHSRLDYVVPVYVTTDGNTQFSVAYLSQSQGVWRRFAGCDNLEGHYNKGNTVFAEHYQAYDLAVQEHLDSLLAAGTPMRMAHIDLPSLGLKPNMEKTVATTVSMVRGGEQMIQDEITRGAPVWDISDKNQLPSTFVRSWVTGWDEGVYGKYLNVVVRSADGKTDYCVAVTEDGMFLKFIQSVGTGQISRFGSPTQIPQLSAKTDSLMTPIIEYDVQTAQIAHEQPKIARRKTIVTGSQGRERIRRLHETGSPLTPLLNGVSPLIYMVRAGNIAQAKARVDQGTGKSAVSDKPMPELNILTITGAIKQRFRVMTEAYALYSSSGSAQEAEAQMTGMGLTPRDIFLIRRYWNGRLDLPESKKVDFNSAAIRLATDESATGAPEPEEVEQKFQFLVNAYQDYAANPKANLAAMKAAVKDERCIALIEHTCTKFEENRLQRFNAEALEWAKASHFSEKMG